MEVKIKQGSEMLDATIEIVNGVMIVSTKVEKFEPKDGDIVYVKASCENIIIYKEDVFDIGRYVNLSDSKYLCTGDNTLCSKDLVKEIRPATEEEKKKLFDKLKEEGYEFDFEKKELVKLKWEPMAGQLYYMPVICNARFKAVKEDWSDDAMDVLYFSKGWVFRTEEECQNICDKLNQAINQVK